MGGLEANAQDSGGAASLESALAQHRSSSLLEGGVDIDQVDAADGEKIVGHVFGDNTDQVVSTLGGIGGAGGSSLMSKLLPMLAPLVLTFVAKQLGSGAQGQATSASGGGIGDLLGGLLGGNPAGASGGIGDLLGGIRGGTGGSGGIGDILGGLLGSGRK
jgi:hypothetical protein